jgi:poly(3-hydroxybutyrate) depolymerase
MKTSSVVWCTISLVVAGGIARGASLGAYHVDPSGVTVAGISSGAFMAVQLQVAYSSRFHGAAVIAGGPYYCAQGSSSTATGACESGSSIPVSALTAYTSSEAAAGAIDATSNLASTKFYLFSGTQDTTVHQAVMNSLQQYLGAYTQSGNVTYNNGTQAAHGWISPDATNTCTSSYVPYINQCNLDVESTFLSLFYGTLAAKNTGTLGGSYVQFEQTPYCGSAGCAAIDLDSTGWAYVPQSCAGGATCKLVVALHGCLMYQGIISQQFVQKSGINEWADTNDIIVLYPQATTSSGNPYGCWDWWGYTGANYAVKSAPQMSAIMAMVGQLGGGTGTPPPNLVDGGVPPVVTSDASVTNDAATVVSNGGTTTAPPGVTPPPATIGCVYTQSSDARPLVVVCALGLLLIRRRRSRVAE